MLKLQHNDINKLYFQVHLLQSNADNDVDWDDVTTKGHILVGANMLNRGFTVEKLSTTFMPRTNLATATADTIEQRCRFFGYKMKYIDVRYHYYITIFIDFNIILLRSYQNQE